MTFSSKDCKFKVTTGLCGSKKESLNTMENNAKIKIVDLNIFKYE